MWPPGGGFFFFFLSLRSFQVPFFFFLFDGVNPPTRTHIHPDKKFGELVWSECFGCIWPVLVAFVGIVGQLLRVLIIHTFSRERVKERPGIRGKSENWIAIEVPKIRLSDYIGFRHGTRFVQLACHICLAIHMHCISLFSFSLP